MPQIDLITPVYYNPNDPYHYLYDNLPLKNIITRQILINLSVDNVIEQMADAVGTQNTVANRLNQSINADGSLKTASIDAAMHTMDDHTDTVNYVRMSKEQSDKLDLVADSATNFGVDVQLDSIGNNVVSFTAGKLKFVPSDSVTFSIASPNMLSMNLAFPATAAHQHYYDQTPVSENSLTPDYIHYKVNSMATPFIDGSLRVYINGIRLSSTDSVYVPGDNNVWTLFKFTPDYANGRFYLSAPAPNDDVIKIDYDTPLT